MIHDSLHAMDDCKYTAIQVCVWGGGGGGGGRKYIKSQELATNNAGRRATYITCSLVVPIHGVYPESIIESLVTGHSWSYVGNTVGRQ